MTSRAVDIATTLGRRRSVQAAAVALFAAGFASAFLPLLEAPGYELGEAGALLAAALAPALGIAAARRERERDEPSPGAAVLGAAPVLAALLLALLAGALLRAAMGPCSAITGAGLFFPLLALPSAILGLSVAAVGTFAARGRRLGAALLYVLLALVSLAWTLREGYVGPGAFLFDPLLGAWPGPLYDEALRVDARLVLERSFAAAAGLALAALAETAARLARPAPRRLRRAAGPLLAVLLLVTAAGGVRAGQRAAGLAGDHAAVERALGGRREGNRCTVVLPSERPRAFGDALLAECEFHVADVAAALGVAHPPHVTAYVYRSTEEKRRLTGAAVTEFAKPWLSEVHVVDAPLPHPVLRHEVVHAIAGALADGPLHVPARAGVVVSAGLVEGLAAALEVPRGGWTVHEWSRAAKDLGMLPDVRSIVGPAGFWSQAPARAYTAAGSFLAFLLERHGARAVAAAYRSGDVAAATGLPLDALVAEWDGFLARTEVPEPLRAAARARFSRGSIFARSCAREAAVLESEAAAASAAGRAGEAVALYDRVARFGGAAQARKAAGDALARAGDLDLAGRAYGEAAALARAEDVVLRDAIAAAEGDLAWRRDDVAGAAERFGRALERRPDRAEERLLSAKLVALGDPPLADAARAYLVGGGDATTALARLARVPHPLSSYLVGRALVGRGEHAAGAEELSRAAAGGLPEVLDREARLLLGEARCASGARAEGEQVLAALRKAPAGAAERERILAAERRCAFRP